MIEEIGEAAALIKEKGDAAIMAGQNAGHAFDEEMAGVPLAYCSDMGLPRAGFGPRFAKNMAGIWAGIIRMNIPG